MLIKNLRLDADDSLKIAALANEADSDPASVVKGIVTVYLRTRNKLNLSPSQELAQALCSLVDEYRVNAEEGKIAPFSIVQVSPARDRTDGYPKVTRKGQAMTEAEWAEARKMLRRGMSSGAIARQLSDSRSPSSPPVTAIAVRRYRSRERMYQQRLKRNS